MKNKKGKWYSLNPYKQQKTTRIQILLHVDSAPRDFVCFDAFKFFKGKQKKNAR